MAGIDFKKLIAEVAKRHQILLREDDPSFAIVNLNQLVFETVTKEMFKKVRALTAEFKAAADQVQTCAGDALRDLHEVQPKILALDATNLFCSYKPVKGRREIVERPVRLPRLT